MSGTRQGGLNAAATNKKRYGDDFYKVIGCKGGKMQNSGGFGSNKTGRDGLTGRQRARIAGIKGGLASRRHAH